MLILRWTDTIRKDDKVEVHYDLALVDILSLKNNGNVNKNTGMIEALQVAEGDQRIIPIKWIVRAVHLIPSDAEGSFYINNYIDLEMYNLVY